MPLTGFLLRTCPKARGSTSSFSIASTRPPVATSSRVSAPLPGPISRIISPGFTFTASASECAAQRPVRKCCPNLAPLFFLPDFIEVIEEPAFFLRGCAFGVGEQARINVGKEFGRERALSRAVFCPLVRIAQEQMLARPRERDVKKRSEEHTS